MQDLMQVASINLGIFLDKVKISSAYLSNKTGVRVYSIEMARQHYLPMKLNDIKLIAQFMGLPLSTFFHKYVDYIAKVVVTKDKLSLSDRLWLIYANEMIMTMLDLMPKNKAFRQTELFGDATVTGTFTKLIKRSNVVPILMRMPRKICGIVSGSMPKKKVMLLNNVHPLYKVMALLTAAPNGTTSLDSLTDILQAKYDKEIDYVCKEVIVPEELVILYKYIEELGVNLEVRSFIDGGLAHHIRRRRNKQ